MDLQTGLTPSQIGVSLRNSHGVARVCLVTGSKILRILKSKGLPPPPPTPAPDLPGDLDRLTKKAVPAWKHLEKNRDDKNAKCTWLWQKAEFTGWPLQD